MGFVICAVALSCAAAVVILIKIDTNPFKELAVTAAASALFVLLGVLCALFQTNDKMYYIITMLPGLVLAFSCDISFALRNIFIEKSDNCVMVEYILAMLSQMFYIVLLSCLAPLSWYSVATALVFFAAAPYLTKRLCLGTGMGVRIALIRMGIMSLLVGFAAGAAIESAGLLSGALLFGSVLFYVSNGLRCYLELTQRDIKAHKTIRLACCYTAQIIFALSILL